MCWIAWFTWNNIIDKKNILNKMTNSISHRWPDDEWFFINSNISLGHRRLSIIDLWWWHQPITINWYTIVFNWEIYNFKEIKNKLIKEWYEFKTNSDTEVLLIWYIKYKEKILEKLNWMFAFVIYSEKDNNIFFARDRLWIKPFYYSIIDNEFIFWSEIKVILNHPNIKKIINYKVINSYFQYRYILGDETFFEWIKKVLPWEYWFFKLNTKQLIINNYWDLEVIEKKEDLWEEYYKNKAKELFEKSIEYRMISDVKVWAYLSWWLDSSLVSAIMQKKSNKPIHTFTIWFKEEWFNEFEFSRIVSKYIWSIHKEILLTPENYLEQIKKLIKYKDSPLSVPNEVPLYLMSKELKKDITVVLSWEWADELFWWYWKIFKLYLETDNDNILESFLNKYNYTSNDNLNKILSDDIQNEIKNKKYTNSIFENYFNKIKNIDIKDKIPYIFEKLHLPWLLERVDMTTMAVWVEARVPFVDYKLVEFINTIPFKYKIKWLKWYNDENIKSKKIDINQISENFDITKYLIREISKDYLPKEIINRKKVWFPVPLDNWFKWDFNNYAIDILLNKRTLNRWIYNKDYLLSKKWLKELSWINIWMMINLELFFREYFD